METIGGRIEPYMDLPDKNTIPSQWRQPRDETTT